MAMNAVGVRDLKNRLSHHLKRVRAGMRLTVTERGKAIARLVPVEEKDDVAWLHEMVAEGRAHWNGGKPTGSRNPPRNRGRKLASDMVIEDRR
jgi:prevent-host-death family protein